MDGGISRTIDERTTLISQKYASIQRDKILSIQAVQWFYDGEGGSRLAQELGVLGDRSGRPDGEFEGTKSQKRARPLLHRRQWSSNLAINTSIIQLALLKK